MGAQALTESVARHVDGLSKMPNLLSELLDLTPGEDLGRRPAPDRWSILEILDHLFDIECAIRDRSMRVVEQADAMLELYHPHAERTRLTHSGGSERRLERFSQARRTSLDWLRALPSDAWHRTGQNRRLGEIRLHQIVCLWRFHDLGHLRQVAEVLRAVSCWQGMGPLQSGYSINGNSCRR